jgi:hypothetical protein
MGRRQIDGRFPALFSLICLLGARLNAVTLMVTNTADSGTGSLRQAILDSNASVGVFDTIAFNVSGAGCTGSPAICTIGPSTGLPAISDPVILDATTQPGYSGSPLIEIITSSLSDGLLVTAGGTTIQGLSIDGFTYGLRFTGNGNNTVQGNWIGLRANGAQGGNAEGIHVSSSGNLIGGTTAAQRNLVSTNLNGIVLDSSASNNSIQGNFIGTNPAGSAARPNGTGVNLGGTLNTVGGTTPGSGNLISGNGGTALSIIGFSHFVQGNLIGTDVTGTAPIPNGSFFPSGGAVVLSGLNTIGGTVAGAANVVAFNAHTGISVLAGVNRINGNSIHGNGDLGIDLAGDGVTPNDPGDSDSGPNNLQNFPVLTLATISGGSVSISGTLNSIANSTFRIEFFASSACDPSGYGEGEEYLGFTSVATNGSGDGSFGPISFPISGGRTVLTATATDPSGNTSEFSACFTASRPTQFYTLTPCRVADTRSPSGPYGGPALAANADRIFVVAGQCGIPSGAVAVAFNFTVTQPTSLGDLRAAPGGGLLPLVSTMNWRASQTRANNAIIFLGLSGDILVHVAQASGTAHLIIDVNGYFQ